MASDTDSDFLPWSVTVVAVGNLTTSVPGHAKRVLCHMRTTEVQISLHIRAV